MTTFTAPLPVALPGLAGEFTRELHVQVLLAGRADRVTIGGFARNWQAVQVLPESRCCDNDDKDDASMCSACVESWAIDHHLLATTVGPAGSALPEVQVLTNRELERMLELVTQLGLS